MSRCEGCKREQRADHLWRGRCVFCVPPMQWPPKWTTGEGER